MQNKFPTNPNIGDISILDGITFVYTGDKNVGHSGWHCMKSIEKRLKDAEDTIEQLTDLIYNNDIQKLIKIRKIIGEYHRNK